MLGLIPSFETLLSILVMALLTLVFVTMAFPEWLRWLPVKKPRRK